MAKSIERKTKEFTPGNCPVVHCMNYIGGKWKPGIIYMIRNGVNRYSLLLKQINEISKQTLTNQLRELEADGVLERIVFPEIPPRVEYKITKFGQSLLPIIDQMSIWGRKNMSANKKVKCEN